MDPVNRKWTLEFVKGSHKGKFISILPRRIIKCVGGWFLPRTFGSKEAKWFKEGELPEVPDKISEENIIGWKVEPGKGRFLLNN